MPIDIHPWYLEREDGSRMNYNQLIPYLSREARNHWREFSSLQTIFADLFAYIQDEVCFFSKCRAYQGISCANSC